MTTVGEIMAILSKYHPNTIIAKHDPNGTGYHRIVITRMMAYQLMVNKDTSQPYDFVDCFADETPEAFTAIVL